MSKGPSRKVLRDALALIRKDASKAAVGALLSGSEKKGDDEEDDDDTQSEE